MTRTLAMSKNVSPFCLLIGSRDRKATGRLSSPKQERQRGQNPKPSPAQTDRSVPACSPGSLVGQAGALTSPAVHSLLSGQL